MHSQSPCTTAPARWGTYRSDLTRDYPAIAAVKLTDAEIDCLYLVYVLKLSEREAGREKGVSGPAVHKHLSRAVERLSAAVVTPTRPGPLPRPARASCAACDAPHVPCRTCMARLMRQRAVYRDLGRAGLRLADVNAILEYTPPEDGDGRRMGPAYSEAEVDYRRGPRGGLRAVSDATGGAGDLRLCVDLEAETRHRSTSDPLRVSEWRRARNRCASAGDEGEG